jgi:signal transduction histidine kinase
MSDRLAPDRFITHSHWLVTLIGYVLIVVVALRRVGELEGTFIVSLALGLMGVFTLLYASEAWLSRRFSSYSRLYFAVQFLIVQGLSAFQDYQDTWAFLFVALGFQVAARASRREALTWGGLFLVSALVTMSLEFGLISGLGRALAFIVIGVFLVSFDIQVSQHEDALAESQVLLGELQEAHEKLQAYAARADQLAAVQERERLIQELYDSVGQKVFAIQLAAEATRLMLAKDPSRAALQIEDLQAQTQSALSQMRQLIGQWRP